MNYDAYDLLLMSDAENEGMILRVCVTWMAALVECDAEGRPFSPLPRNICAENMATDDELALQDEILTRYLGGAFPLAGRAIK